MTDNMIRWEQADDGVVTLTMDDRGQSANTMNATYRHSMEQTVDRLEAERAGITGVVLTSAKKTFFAGGDLRDLIAVRADQAEEFFADVEAIKAVLRRFERLGVPTVAAINGAALGGGLEIALACQHRIAADGPGVTIGFPEVTLGLLPAGGGVTRSVRMLGIQAALTDWLLRGQQYGAQRAMEKGLVEQVVPAPKLMDAAYAWVREHREDETAASKPWDRPGYRLPGGTPSTPALAAILPSFPATLRKQLGGAPYPAPKAILAAAVEGAQVDVDTASRIESRYMTSLVTGQTAKNMTQAFFFDLAALGALRPKGIEPVEVRKVGVLGAGMMGSGIAEVCRAAGLDVVVKDVDDDISVLTGCDVVIEAVFEDQGLKERLLREAEGVVDPDALICSNTSTLPISVLAQAVSRPADVIGLHFFSPVAKMRLVEIIRGEQTSDRSVARAIDLVQRLRKLPIVVRDGRGFYTSRVYGTLLSEAASLLEEGVGPVTIERAATLAGFPAPPLAMTDEVSLTLGQHIRREAENAARAAGRELPPVPGQRVIDRLVELGRPGRAGGAGFYDYPAEGRKRLWPGLADEFPQSETDPVPVPDIVDRYLFVMALETAKCLEEGIVTDTASANIGSIFGIGYPAWTGGTAQLIHGYEGTSAEGRERRGVVGFVSRADELAKRYGERFRPTPWLREKALEHGGQA